MFDSSDEAYLKLDAAMGSGRRALVAGLGASGRASLEYLLRRGWLASACDSREKVPGLEGFLSAHPGISVSLGGIPESLPEGVDLVVMSPGISPWFGPAASLCAAARSSGVPVAGEIELFAQELAHLRKTSGYAPKVIGITGTNGKTTTVTLLGEIFRNAGRTTHVVGNIGYPYSAAGLDSQDNDLFVCEVSSFQMETAETFHPKAAALLNITEDHLNRHGTMEVYTAMKMRQFQNMTAEDVAVFNADDPALAPLIGQVKAQVMLFSRKREVEQGAFVRDGEIVVRFHGAEETICPAKDVFIPGPHNLENALAACCIAVAMGVKPDVIANTLRTFQGVEHRIEFFRELDGVRYINDSKGTNVDSTIKAIQTMTRPTAIILGGYDKHCDFTPMVQEMLASPYIKEAVLIGATADQIERTCRENGYTHLHRAGTLKDAIDQCRALSSDGWNVLLSPACASFDMFSDYESRGRIFKELVRELK